ncbi:YjgB family protein [Paenibacillus sp. PR3]|uniref:YjgB family protein n=1 Tax=Paenibacillus terricola TaxID=2763503 RepID=A0ABR8MRE0_9BACL|nr:YjgB family protein [Paenibacillus terricola]MBD3917482.1 YjgB family protein [Paenibacillus terricola]
MQVHRISKHKIVKTAVAASVALMLSACGENVKPNEPQKHSTAQSIKGPSPNTVHSKGKTAHRINMNAYQSTPPTNIVSRSRSYQTSEPTNKQIHHQFIERISELAKQGQMVNADNFAVGKTKIDEVHKAWGEPNRKEGGFHQYMPGMMKGTIAFSPGRGGVLKEIRISETGLDPIKDGAKITSSEVRSTLGKPFSMRKSGKKTILLYKRGPYQLKFAYTTPKPTRTNNAIPLDYVSVVSPKADKPLSVKSR